MAYQLKRQCVNLSALEFVDRPPIDARWYHLEYIKLHIQQYREQHKMQPI
jgi:hypothetical protein